MYPSGLIIRAFRFAPFSTRLLLPCISTWTTDTALWSLLLNQLLNESFPAPIIKNVNTLSLKFLSLLHLLPPYKSCIYILCWFILYLLLPHAHTRMWAFGTIFFCLFHLLLSFQNLEQCPTHSKCPMSIRRGSEQVRECGTTRRRLRHRSGGR